MINIAIPAAIYSHDEVRTTFLCITIQRVFCWVVFKSLHTLIQTLILVFYNFPSCMFRKPLEMLAIGCLPVWTVTWCIRLFFNPLVSSRNDIGIKIRFWPCVCFSHSTHLPVVKSEPLPSRHVLHVLGRDPSYTLVPDSDG